MKTIIALTVCLIVTTSAWAEPQFLLGDGKDWGASLSNSTTGLDFRIGGRLQSLATGESVEDEGTNQTTESQDFSTRRARLQIEAKFPNNTTFYMDLRDDQANTDDQGENQFRVGNAYVNIPLSEDSNHAFRLVRSKVDVSRIQTMSDSVSLFVNRPYVTDEAAQYVTQNRRATNIQMNGHFNKKLSYHWAVGDGVHSATFRDAKGQLADKITRQNFMVGAKVRLHPFGGWDSQELTDSYFGEGQHFSIGMGHFNTSNIHVESSGGAGRVTRNLTNTELSFHYRAFSFTAEAFKFGGAIEDLSVADYEIGTGEGHYAQAEWVFAGLSYLAPFVRTEKRNMFQNDGDYESTSQLTGINWYLNGNRIRATLASELTKNGKDVAGDEQTIKAMHFATMWIF